MTITISDLSPEVLETLARAENRSALIREALIAYVRAGPEREALARIERKIDALTARLAALEAGGVVPAPPPPEAPAPEDAVRKAATSLAAWCVDA